MSSQTNLETYRCSQCEEALSRDHDLERHRLAKHASEAERMAASYFCRCGAHSIQKANIAGHIRSAHTGEKIRCGTCTFEATSDATLTRHRQETGHIPAPRRRKPRVKKANKNSASSSSSPTPEIRTVADFINLYGNAPLTYAQYTLYTTLVANEGGQVLHTPPGTSATSPPSAAPLSAVSISSSSAPVQDEPSVVMARPPTPTPPPHCFLPIPDGFRLPPIGLVYRDHHSTAPLTARILQPRLSSHPSRYHRYGPY